MDFIETKKAPGAVGPYSQGTKFGDMIIVSGQLPIKDGELQLDAKKATRASLENILAIVEEAGGKKETIARCGIFLTDLGDFEVVNKEYEAFFGDHKPARACVEVSRLPKDATVEIEAIAFVE